MKISSNKLIEIYTDGACSGNPGPGGWGAIILFNKLGQKILLLKFAKLEIIE